MSDVKGDTAIGISYSVQVGDGKNVVFQTHVAQAAGVEELHRVTDLLHFAADRQVARGKIDQIDQDIERNYHFAKQLDSALDNVEAKLKALAPEGRNGRLPKAEIAEKENALKSRAMHLLAIKELKEKREALVKSLET